MNLRQRAQRFLEQQGISGGHLATSKFYGPDESWTKDKAWWVQIPWSAVRGTAEVHIVLEASPNSQAWRYLRVPTEYLLSHRRDFATIAPDSINLFLCADEEQTEFQDQRGPGRVPFAHFEQPIADDV